MHPSLQFCCFLTAFLGIASCSAPTPKRQAFPLLDRTVQAHIKAGDQVVYPQLVYSPKPEYPALPASGSVWAVMRVSGLGKVTEVKIVGQAPELYQDSIRAALLKWRFNPGSIDGQPAEFPMQVKVTFQGHTDSKEQEGKHGASPKDGILFKNEQWIVQSVFPELHERLSILNGQGKKMVGPKVIKTWKPQHPNPLAEGSVYVAFVVNAEAKAEQIHIVGDTPKLFQEVIAEALDKWEFQAGTVDGKPYPYPVAGKWSFATYTVFMLKP